MAWQGGWWQGAEWSASASSSWQGGSAAASGSAWQGGSAAASGSAWQGGSAAAAGSLQGALQLLFVVVVCMCIFVFALKKCGMQGAAEAEVGELVPADLLKLVNAARPKWGAGPMYFELAGLIRGVQDLFLILLALSLLV